jgi:hypothetical protein
VTDDLPEKWRKVNEPDAGTYSLVKLTGYTPPGGGISVCLYVCDSDKGYLSEAFQWGDPAWEISWD